MHGIIPLWKPVGLTSHDCVMKMRRIFRTKKVGHTGTLDPEVAGVLPICIGEATKIVPYLTDTKKTYQAEVTLGYATDTEDQTGKIVETSDDVPSFTNAALEQVLAKFQGEITQVVPLYSAVKVNGKKLYEYARANQPVERPSRQTMIFSIELMKNSIKEENGLFRFGYEVTCSKGTYIRTLSLDIGKALGFPAHMSHLIRTATGNFTRENSYTLEEIEAKRAEEKHENLLVPFKQGVDHLPVWSVDEEVAKKVLNGQKLNKPAVLLPDIPYRVEVNDHLLAIYQQHPTKPELMKPSRVFRYD